jgi:mTERF
VHIFEIKFLIISNKMHALARFRANQLRFLAPHIQWRPISSSQWPLNEPTTSAPSESSPPPPTRPSSSSSLVPVTNKQRDISPSLTDIVSSAIHRLVLLVTSLRRASANEIYVRRILQNEIGIHPLELDLLSLYHPEIFRLSVRHSIEPAIQFLRSQGLTGSALAQVISRAPGVLSSSVEEQVMPVCVFLNEKLGTQGMGALIRYPPIVEISPSVLRDGFEVLIGAGATQEECTFFLRKFSELFARFCTLLGHNKDIITNRGLDLRQAAQIGGTAAAEEEEDKSTDTETGKFSTKIFYDNSNDQVEQVLFFFRALKTGSANGWDVKIAETELHMLLDALEKDNK